MTMADIARLAGVSVSTVSRALNGNPSIPERTRSRILAIAREHNYILDSRAQNFRLGRSRTIAVVFPYLGESRRTISDPFYMEIMGAIADELDLRGYDMIVSRVHSVDEEWPLRYIMNKRADGVLLIDRSVEDQGIARLRELGAPFVAWGSPLAGQDYASVGGDSVQGAARAVVHLAALGRRRIGFIGGHERMVETYLRRQGYENGLRESGLPFDPVLVAYTDFTPQASHEALRTLLVHAPDLDGVFVCSDFMAISVMQMLREDGRRIPDDVAVVGYDDIQLAGRYNPRLTTIRQLIDEGGRLLVARLFDLLDGAAPEPLILPIELIVRDSCGG